jgi:hypothetical protein
MTLSNGNFERYFRPWPVLPCFSGTMHVGPSEQYLAISQHPSILLSEPKKPLIVLDLHGTLCHADRNPEDRLTIGCFTRPNFEPFMDYLVRYFEIAIWSSGRPESVEFLTSIFKKEHVANFKLIWTRENFGLTSADYQEHVLTYKDLDRLWEHIAEKKIYYPNAYNASNTILLDDSFEKCCMQPHNCVVLRTFDPNDKVYRAYGDNELRFLIPYLERARHQSNISNWMRRNPYVSIHPAETTALNLFDVKYVPRGQPSALSKTLNISQHLSPLLTKTDGSMSNEEMRLENVEVTKISIKPPGVSLKTIQKAQPPDDVQPAEFEKLYNKIFRRPASFLKDN